MSEARVHIDAQLQVRRDIEANWRAVDPVLRDGEIAYSKDVRRIKIGDGASAWSELNYLITDNVELGHELELILQLLEDLQGFKDLFYLTEDGKSIGTKLNLFSEGTLASKGKGESGTGSSDLVIMESWEQYDSTLAQVLGAALGIELHNRLTAVENGQVDIDLSPYATIEFVQQAISALIGGADAAYDTLVEIQNILQGNEAGIETILTEIASKASKAELKEVSDIVTEQGKRIAELEEGGGMFEWVVDEDGTRRIKTVYDFYSDGTIGSGGKGAQGEEAGEGTVVAVSVNGETYEAEDGIVTLPDYPTKTSYDSKVSDLESKDSEHEEVLDELAESNELLTKKVGTAEGYIKTHEKRLTEIEKITSLFGLDENGIYTEKNFRSTGTLASGGVGEQGEAEGGGIQAISLNGETYDDADGDGVIELPKLPTMQDLQEAVAASAFRSYTHVQGTASTTWYVEHEMGRYPSVTVVDSAGTMVIGDVSYNNENSLTITFSVPFSGKAFMN